MMNPTPHILVTNDDGIKSPAIWKLAEVLATFAKVTIVAPAEQFSGAGRSYTGEDGALTKIDIPKGSQIHAVYSAGVTPAKAVLFAIVQLLADTPPDLVVSGINYGENPGNSITASGTVGAGMEAVVNGVRALAVSRCVPMGEYHSYSEEYDFSTAAHFSAEFAKTMLFNPAFADIEMLKLDVPANATPETECKITRLSKYRYYEPVLNRDTKGKDKIDWVINPKDERIMPGDDVYALLYENVVTVTPLTMDMTARVPFSELQASLEQVEVEG